MKISKVLIGVAATIGLVHGTAVSVMKNLQTKPNLYPSEMLNREPQGEEAYLSRPDGTRLRVVWAGNGPTVVLAHGFGATLLEWNVVYTQLLKAGYRVITFDQRGHGRSTIGADGLGSAQMAGDYKAILEHFDVQGGVLVGHSMGGFIANVFMLTYPGVAAQRLKGTVLFATFAGNVMEGSLQNRLEIPMIKTGIMDKVVQSDVYGGLFVLSLMGKDPYPAAIAACLQIFRSQQFRPLLPIVQAFCDEDYYSRLPEIKTPCVVICGKEDKTTPPWHSERMGRDIPNARSIWVKDKGHLLNWEAPEILVQVVQSF